MFSLIYGGSGSGKSAFAEQAVCTLAKDQKKYYLATMQIFDEEGQKKIERHRRLRAGKGFETIEQPLDIGQAAEKMNPEDHEESALLAEALDMEPVIAGGLALGEGTGAVMMFSLLDLAMSIYEANTTFSDIQVEQYTRF